MSRASYRQAREVCSRDPTLPIGPSPPILSSTYKHTLTPGSSPLVLPSLQGSTYEILDVNAVFVANVEPGTDFQALIRHFQAHGGSVAAYHFRAGQRFGFIQFTTPEDCQAAVDHVNDSLFQTSHLHVEKCPRFTPGRDPRMPTEPVSGKSSSCTLVLKNLPFHLKQEKLQDIFGKMDIRPQFVNYHLDRTGAFRGMAFVKFRRMEDAQRAHTFINGMEISSRKIRVEFKQRKNKEKASLEYDLKDPEVARFHNQLVNFRDSMLADMCFPPTLTSAQRKTVHTIAESLGLAHVSLGEGEGRFVTVSRKEGASVAPSLAPTAPAVQTRSSTTVSANSSAGTSPIDVRVSKPPTHQGGTPGNGHNHHKAPSHGPAGLSSGARSRTRSDTSHLSGSPGGRSRTRSDTGHLFGRSPGSSYGKSPSSIVSRLSQYELYTPPTQPTGPDSSSRGFNNGAHRPKYIRQQMELLSRTLGADDDTPNGMSLMQMSLMSRLGHDPSNDSDYNTI
eukprot:TRINITY_DN3720_c0_g1_i3.p1 TRINITY_DN3720_c0_g1~~TRINITY_DN3720_c0_g1_i3.p1  ORF type:complete len:504 (-),score=101.07 TRINITY_DN3720_c0_g1_i3:351-1862(-)